MRAWCALILVAGCGRIEFDEVSPTLGPRCGPAYQPVPELGTRSLYRSAVTAPASWHDAEADCESDGGHLAVIDTALENDWVLAQAPLMAGPGELWLGASDHAAEGAFQWVTGAPLAFSRWSTGEPNDDSGVEDCAHLYTSGEWNDARCTLAIGYVCECDRTLLPAPGEVRCDTDTDSENCGECGTSCSGGVCSDQQCK